MCASSGCLWNRASTWGTTGFGVAPDECPERVLLESSVYIENNCLDRLPMESSAYIANG